MNNTVILYKSIFKKNEYSVELISDVINRIKTDPTVEEITRKIRKCNSDSDRSQLKKQLPAFQPALSFTDDNQICATGIVGFDIDKKDNEDINFQQLKDEIKSITSCVYAFLSPSGGLKFGIQTDFADTADTKENEPRLKARYQEAYKLTHQLVQDKTSIDFIADDTSKSAWQKCYLSHDGSAYINSDCDTHPVNAECTYTPFISQTPLTPQHDRKTISELLECIPRNYSYAERFPVNCSVLKCLGRGGIPLLLQHWDKQEKEELRKQLEYQAEHLNFGDIGYLVNVAKSHGYKQINGWSRRSIEPKPADITFEILLSPEEGTEQLIKIIGSFFANQHNVFVNVTTGAGKSSTVLDILAKEIPYNKKILLLVPSHKLASELESKFKVARNNPTADEIEKNQSQKQNRQSRQATAFLSRMRSGSFSDITHLWGRKELCEFDWAIDTFGGSIPWQFCSGCHLASGCRYIEQFENRFDNIRLMTHHEWFNQQSAWFSGFRDDFTGRYNDYDSPADIPVIFPKMKGWKPDYIIIDENIFNVDINNKKSDSGGKHPSIKKIINSVMSGLSFEDAVIANMADIFHDNFENTKPKYPEFKSNIEDYLHQVNTRNKQLESYSEILERLASYCKSVDPIYLQGMWVDNGILFLAPIIRASDRYMNVPTLFLDATANEQVVKALHPNIEFHSIKIMAKDDIHLYQLANTTVTKSDLQQTQYVNDLIVWIKSIIAHKNYEQIGLITYQKISDSSDLIFDEYLANQLGVKLYSHFGAVRGLDIFEDADCLLIVGRQYIGQDQTKDLASALFNEVHKYTSAYADMPVRMKDGTSKLLNCLIPTAPYHDVIHEHFSQSETRQSIGRARPVHGKPKDIYLFSNESLGLDVEVTDFFRKEYRKSMCSDNAIEHIKKIGYVRNMPKQLVSVGLAANDVRSRKPDIICELADKNIHLKTCKMRDNSNRPTNYEYFIYDTSKFVPGQKIDDKIFESFA